MGCGPGMTCWRRLRDWQAAGVWDCLHRALLDDLGAARHIDWERACVDRASIPAKKGGDATGPNPTDRARPGTNRHLIVDRQGIPLACLLTGPIAMTACASKPLSMPFRRSGRRAASAGIGQGRSMPTRPTTSLAAATSCTADTCSSGLLGGGRGQRTTRAASVGRGTDLRLAEPLSSVDYPLRAPH